MFDFTNIKVNEPYQAVLIIREFAICEAKNGKKYAKCKLQNAVSNIDGKMWNLENENVYEDNAYTVSFHIEEYNCASQAIIEKIEPAPAEVDYNELVPAAPEKPQFMWEYLMELTKQIQNEQIRKLVQCIFQKKKRDLCLIPAAMKIHHAYVGGMLYHTYRMTKAAVQMCAVYPELDQDLMIAGTMLHDIGKLGELEAADDIGLVTNYTIKGNLLGHITLGLLLISPFMSKLKISINDPKIISLLHIVTAHHGELEYGSPKVPSIPEAMVIHHLDMIDSRMDIFKNALKDIEPGTSGEYNRFLNTRVSKEPVPEISEK